MKTHYLLLLAALSVFASCKDTSSDVENPYLKVKLPPKDTIANIPADPNTIAGIYKNVLKPTCANSGCHDGTFEPDFRSIESSYNTLISRPVIKTDTLKLYTQRVVPGNADMSMLIQRLTIDLNGNSGLMPLVVEPGSDWNQKKDQYIQNIRNWINNGAKDFEGKDPQTADYPPQAEGMLAFNAGTTTGGFGRAGKYEPLQVPAGTGNVDIWVCVTDDKLGATGISGVDMNYTQNPFDFSKGGASPMTKVSPQTFKTVYGTDNQYAFKATVDLSSFKKNDVLWFRFFCTDGKNSVSLPSDLSLFNLKKYLCIKII